MINNISKKTIIEFHILQSFPVTCLNRDDVGSPKTAVVGGVLRARVSSQAWKRPVRLAMHELGVKLGIRTKFVAEMIEKKCLEIGANQDEAKNSGGEIASYLTKDTLLFFTETEANFFAQYAKEKNFDVKSFKDKEIIKIAKKVINPVIDGLDIALFGRMVAKAAELDIEAASSFSHAVSTHKILNEIDFFTAVDDIQEEKDSGSSHIGSLEFNSATYYRYISLDLFQLRQTLKYNDVSEAVEAFVRALYVAVPLARQTSMAGFSSWDYAKILVRNSGQRLQVNFDDAVKAKGDGFIKPSIEKLNEQLLLKEKMCGSMFGKVAEIELPSQSIDDLVLKLKEFTKNEH